jgi:hypothetical protein
VENIRRLLHVRSAGQVGTCFLWRIGWILHVDVKWNARKCGCVVLNIALVLGDNVNYYIVNDGVLIIQPIHNIHLTQFTMFFLR